MSLEILENTDPKYVDLSEPSYFDYDSTTQTVDKPLFDVTLHKGNESAEYTDLKEEQMFNLLRIYLKNPEKIQIDNYNK